MAYSMGPMAYSMGPMAHSMGPMAHSMGPMVCSMGMAAGANGGKVEIVVRNISTDSANHAFRLRFSVF